MKQTILEKELNTILNDNIRDNINLHLTKLVSKYEDKYNIGFQWSKKGDKLYANIDKVFCQASFNKKKVKVTMDAPFYVIPFLANYKEVLCDLEENMVKLLL